MRIAKTSLSCRIIKPYTDFASSSSQIRTFLNALKETSLKDTLKQGEKITSAYWTRYEVFPMQIKGQNVIVLGIDINAKDVRLSDLDRCFASLTLLELFEGKEAGKNGLLKKLEKNSPGFEIKDVSDLFPVSKDLDYTGKHTIFDGNNYAFFDYVISFSPKT